MITVIDSVVSYYPRSKPPHLWGVQYFVLFGKKRRARVANTSFMSSKHFFFTKSGWSSAHFPVNLQILFFFFFFFCYLWTSGLVLQTRLLFRLKITHQVFHTEKLFSRYEVSGRMLSYVISKNFSRFSFVFILFCVILFLLHQKSEISHNFSSKTWKCVWPIFLFGNAKNLHDILLSKPFEWYSDFNVKYFASTVIFLKNALLSLFILLQHR